MAVPIGVFLMMSFFKAILKDIEEAARLDGVGWLQIFWYVDAAVGPPGDDDAGNPDVPLRLERLPLAACLGPEARVLHHHAWPWPAFNRTSHNRKGLAVSWPLA